MDREESKKILEALLFVSDKPVSVDTLREVIKEIESAQIKAIIDELNGEYAASGRSFQIQEIAGGFQMLTDPIYSRWIAGLYRKGPDKLTGPSLETLAIIAYKQPITRSDIEAIRGVNVDGVLRTLEERSFIKTKGRLDAPGRPILYVTTGQFLQHFGLRSLDELPKLKEFQESDLDFAKEKDKKEVVDTMTGKLHMQQESASREAESAQDAAVAPVAGTAAPEEAPAPPADADSDINKENVNGPEELAKEN